MGIIVKTKDNLTFDIKSESGIGFSVGFADGIIQSILDCKSNQERKSIIEMVVYQQWPGFISPDADLRDKIANEIYHLIGIKTDE